jgi:hypothetical protein
VTTYAIECPRCAGRAWAEMTPTGRAGTYREPTLRMGVRRSGCDACGYFRDVPPAASDDYLLWFRTDFRGHTLWATNETHLDFLVAWLSGALPTDDLPWPDRALVECLPRWLLKDRAAVVDRLRRLRARAPHR